MPVSKLPEPRAGELKAALEAAALPRRCDAALLAAMLGGQPADAAALLARLGALALVEPCPGGDAEQIRVPAAIRPVLRRVLATLEPDRFRDLSLRAAAHCAARGEPAARIEWLYHLLGGDPGRGAEAVEELDHEWTLRGYSGERRALAATLAELEDTGLAQGRARAWVLLAMAFGAELEGARARAAELGGVALRAAREAEDAAAEAEALCLVGDLRMAQHRYGDAGGAFEDFLRLCQGQVRQQPQAAAWQRRLAAAWSRVGDARQALGKLDAAQAAFGECQASARRMVKQAPEDAGWQRELAVAHAKMGHVMRAQGHLERARADFADYLAGFRRLVEIDPEHLGWRRELGIACGLMAHIRSALDGTESALPYYEESSRILADVVARAPGVGQWAEDLRLIDRELAECRRGRAVQVRIGDGLGWLRRRMGREGV